MFLLCCDLIGFKPNLSLLTSCCPCCSSLTSRRYWRETTRRTTASGPSSTWTPPICASPPLLPLPLRARLRMTAWMSMSGDQVGDWSLTYCCLKWALSQRMWAESADFGCAFYSGWLGFLYKEPYISQKFYKNMKWNCFIWKYIWNQFCEENVDILKTI